MATDRRHTRSVIWRIGWALSPVIMLVASFFVWGVIVSWMQKHPAPRPLFHHNYDMPEMGLWPCWHQIPERTDLHGHIAMADFELNLMVLIASDLPTTGIVPQFYESFSDHTVLLPRTRFELDVRPESDLLLVVSRNGQQGRFHLEPGLAKSLHEKMGGPDDLPDELAALYQGKDRKELLSFVEINMRRPPPK